MRGAHAAITAWAPASLRRGRETLAILGEVLGEREGLAGRQA